MFSGRAIYVITLLHLPGKVGFIPHWRKGNYDEV